MKFSEILSLKAVKILTGILLILTYMSALYSQQIESSVKVVLERLPLEKQKKLKNLADELENYLNDYDWTGNDEDNFQITMQIFLQDMSVNYEDRYSGTFVISNNSDIQFYDKYWVFPYQ